MRKAQKATFIAIFIDEFRCFSANRNIRILNSVREQPSWRWGKVARFYVHFEHEK
jgi:hypothetical protein